MESVGSTEQKKTNGSCHPSFDIENPCTSLVSSMEEELESLSPISSECSIYRVPDRLRHGNERVYTPRTVSIGPLHHGKESLRAMEELKLRHLKAFIERTEKSMGFYIQVVREKEVRLRGCYSETIQFNSDQFVKIILVDAAFIIEVLLKFYLRRARNLDATILDKPWVIRDVSPDMILLENQLPFFILQDLYDASEKMQHEQRPASIVELSFYFFKNVVHSLQGTEVHKLELLLSSRIEHFVDLLRYLYIPSKKQDERQLKTITAPSVTELHQAGVKFKVGSSMNLFDIQFNNGILEIPRFNVGPISELPIRNIVVFEQCSRLENYMNDYVTLLRRLISTILFVRTKRLPPSGPLVGEARAALFAAQEAFLVPEVPIILEGDSLLVLDSINQCGRGGIWQIEAVVDAIRRLSPVTESWAFAYVKRSANVLAHRIVQWASSANLEGNIPTACIPVNILSNDNPWIPP